MALKVPIVKLLDGTSMPILGFGCYKVGVIPGSATGAAGAAKPAPAEQVIGDALAAGYRCFDCAQFYENEEVVGQAFQAAGIPRSELYITSKVWTNRIFEGPAAVREQCLKTMKDLRCEYLDLYMIHWPVPVKHVEAYKELVKLQEEGKVKSIGVSNYTVEDLTDLEAAGLPLPTVNQIEINPFLYRKKTIAHFEAKGIRFQAYRALCNFGKAASLESEVVAGLAAKHSRSPSQILGRWCVQKGFQHIPKSEKRSRMDENAQIFDFSLDAEDMEKLENLTTEASLATFKSSYQKGVLRDTPLEAHPESAKSDITLETGPAWSRLPPDFEKYWGWLAGADEKTMTEKEMDLSGEKLTVGDFSLGKTLGTGAFGRDSMVHSRSLPLGDKTHELEKEDRIDELLRNVTDAFSWTFDSSRSDLSRGVALAVFQVLIRRQAAQYQLTENLRLVLLVLDRRVRLLKAPLLSKGVFVTHKGNGRHYALKTLKKAAIIKMKQVDHIMSEKQILAKLQHPFIVNMFGSFHDPRYIYMVLEYIVGGEFFTHLRKAGRFENEQSLFYAAQITCIFEYCHELNIVYRDLKPENILINADGYVKLTDFGFAKVIEHRTYTLCGTPEYIAPEVLLNKGHGKPVDWWTLGILVYEMIVGYPPFVDEDPMGIYQKILAGKITFPKIFHKEAKSLVKKLLTPDLGKRFGNLKNGAADIKEHKWFKDLSWDDLVAKKIEAPFKPAVKGATDTSNFDDYPDSDQEPPAVNASQDPFTNW
eukprot:symbB.v1.2.025734.t2/scaffold2517.1/size77087/3